MTIGMALTVGLNAVDQTHYNGWPGTLNACEFDANDMAEIAKFNDFQVKTLLTKEATRANVIDEISKATSALAAGDIFMFSYSGHGGQVPELNDGGEVRDTICLYDGELIDEELHNEFAKFSKDVRVLAIADSCHSGTVIKEEYLMSIGEIKEETLYRYMPPKIALQVYQQNKTFYDKILGDKSLKDAEDEIKASALLLAACQDGETSADGKRNGLFTSKLLNVWNKGNFKGNYREFYDKICSLMPPYQNPNYYRTGQINPTFEKQQVFEI